jgi:hypothetical protein
LMTACQGGDRRVGVCIDNRFLAQSGKHLLDLRLTAIDPMYGPAVRYIWRGP